MLFTLANVCSWVERRSEQGGRVTWRPLLLDILGARHAHISGHIERLTGSKKSSTRRTNYRSANYCSHSSANFCSRPGLRSGSGCRSGYEPDPLLARDFNKTRFRQPLDEKRRPPSTLPSLAFYVTAHEDDWECAMARSVRASRRQ